MSAHWGTFNKIDSLGHCHALAATALADEGLNVEDTAGDGPQFLLGSRPGLTTSVFLFAAGPMDTRMTVAAFSSDSAAAEGARNRIRQRISENVFFQPTASPWAVLLCKFSDDATEPRTRSFYDNLFTVSGRGTHNMVDYFRDASHRRIDTSGTRVFGWYTLPKRHSDYTGTGANQAGRDELVAWARQAAADGGVDLSPFVGVVVCMNVYTDLFGGGGRVVCDTRWQPSALGQEMGHGYGLTHSRTDGSTTDYTDRWDTMSTYDSCYMASHPQYTLIGPGLNAANMAGRGWLDAARVWNAPSSIDTVVTLRPLVRFDLPGKLAARVGPYLIEFRVKESWDQAIPEPTVLIHRLEDNRSYIMSSVNGHQGLIKGDVFEIGSPSRLFEPWRRVEVTDIDSVGQSATLHVTVRPRTYLPFPWALTPGTVFAGIPDEGNAWTVIDGIATPIPLESPLFDILTQLASIRTAELTTGAALHEAHRSEGLAATRRLLSSMAEEGHGYTSPAPHSTDGQLQLETTVETTEENRKQL
jgi:hypothetical protein